MDYVALCKNEYFNTHKYNIHTYTEINCYKIPKKTKKNIENFVNIRDLNYNTTFKSTKTTTYAPIEGT